MSDPVTDDSNSEEEPVDEDALDTVSGGAMSANVQRPPGEPIERGPGHQ